MPKKDEPDMGGKVKTMMKNLPQNFVATLKSQRGSAAVDYAVILVFIVLVVIVVVVSLQDRSEVIFNATATVIGDFGRIPAQ